MPHATIITTTQTKNKRDTPRFNITEINCSQTSVALNQQIINTAQLNQDQIQENIYKREETNANFQTIINEHTNLELPDIAHRQNMVRVWSNQRWVENNQVLKNLR